MTRNEPPLTRDLRNQLWSSEDFVVDFPFEWITANDGVRRLVKYEGNTDEANYGRQGDSVPLQSRKKVG